VYKNKPRTTVDLKQSIKDEAAGISPTMQMMQNFQQHLQECVDKGCHHTNIFRK